MPNDGAERRLGYSDTELDAILARADRNLIYLLLSSFTEITLSEEQVDRVLAVAYRLYGEQPAAEATE